MYIIIFAIFFLLSLIVFQHPFLIVSIYHNERASVPVIFIVFNVDFKPALNNANNATVLGSTAVVIQQFFHI